MLLPRVKAGSCLGSRAAGRTQRQGRGGRSPPGPPRPFAPRPEVSGFFCCCAAARQKRLPGPWAAGCPPARLPARPAAREAASAGGRLLGGRRETARTGRSPWKQLPLRATGETPVCRAPRASRWHGCSTRICCAGLQPARARRASRRGAAKGGGRERAARGRPLPRELSFQHRQLQPFPAEGADGGRDRSVSPGVGLCCGGGSCDGGWRLGCWWEWGTPAGKSSGDPMGHTRTSGRVPTGMREQTGTPCRAPTGMHVHPGTSCSAVHMEGQSLRQGQEPRSGAGELPGCVRRDWQLAAGLCNRPACLHKRRHCRREVRGPQGGARAWRAGVWGGGPAPCPAAPCRELD